MKDNTVLAIAALCNMIKDIAVVAIFGFLAYHFNNFWITLLGVCFMGGINVKFSSKDKKSGEEDNENGK